MVAHKPPVPQFRHTNGNVIIGIYCRTTGPIPGHHEITQFACVMVDDSLHPVGNHAPLVFAMFPYYPERAVQFHKERLNKGLDPAMCADVFSDWYDSLGFAPGKRFWPIGYETAKHLEFVRHWLTEHDADRIFESTHLRDAKVIAHAMNDKSALTRRPYEYPKLGLSGLAHTLGVRNEVPKDALHCALTAIEIYRRLLVKMV